MFFLQKSNKTASSFENINKIDYHNPIFSKTTFKNGKIDLK